MKIETPPLVFIVAIPKRFGKLYVRVHVYDRRDQMLHGIAAAHGGHDHETASTVIEPFPVRGRLADMFFTFRCARPGIIAHESMHAAWACTKFIWGIGPDDEAVEENFAQIAERLTDRIWTRIHESRLA
jgi:hypothetical protein